MLQHLAIKNLAVIEHTAIDFTAGLNVLTGETGAGKSIVVGALSLVLGDRAKSDVVRVGARSAEVQAVFAVPESSPTRARLEALELSSTEPGEMVVRRVVNASGGSRVWVNGVIVNVGTLAQLTSGLVDVSSQHQHTHLLDPTGHLDLLDRFGGLTALRTAYDDAWRALEEARAAARALDAREKKRAEREDFVRFQLDEIDALDPQPGEDAALSQERSRLAHAEQLSGGAHKASHLLTGAERSVDAILRGTLRELERLVDLDDGLGPLTERLETARIEVEDIGFDLSRYAAGVEADPRRLEQVDERLSALRRLERKHGGDIDSVLAQAEALRSELAAFESLELEQAEAHKVRAARLERAQAAAEALSAARIEAARALEAQVDAELASLAMKGAAIRFQLARTDALGPAGLDAGELLIRTNPGAPHAPLARVASGGELSRLLLALKRAFTRVDTVASCVFDEVDTGVGGATAEVIGLKLKEIAAERQVISITHLPQIAAHGGHHLKVEKTSADDRVVTRVRALEPAERTEEIARMLGGVTITAQTRAHAAELLALSAGQP